MSKSETLLSTPISINNSGLVLLQSFLNPYFQRIGLLDGDRFTGEQQQRDAVNYLQFLATGQAKTDEQYLVLNKIFCGLELHEPIDTGINISAKNKELAEGLIQAVIQHWSAIGSSSVDGFRGNWLIRDGVLSETEEQWELTVEKRPYDILLERLPFSYNIIKLPWMTKPLCVNWEY